MSYDLLRANGRLIRENSDLRKALKEVIKAKSESECKMIARRALGLAPRVNVNEGREVWQVFIDGNGEENLVNLADVAFT